MRPWMVDAVLARLNVEGRRPISPACEMVYAAWCGAVPFDNSRKMIHVAESRPGPPPGSPGEACGVPPPRVIACASRG